MAQDDAAISRAVALLSSSDINENKNGAALVINTAANAHSIPKLLRNNVVNLLLPKLGSNDEDLVMKACWAVNNMSVHDEGRNACFNAGALQYFGKVLQSKNSEVIKKASWALTNLARNPEAQREIIRGPIFTGLVNVLIYGKDDEEKGFVLQPLCNLVLDANNQLAFKNAGGIPSVVKLLSSSVAKTQELAITLISFVTTNHDSIRDDLVECGVLHPLCELLSGAKSGKLQEYAINSLVNLSLSENAEREILSQGAVRTVVGLLSCEDPKLQQQSAMLLSNLLTNKDIRESVRYYGWVDPVLKLVRSADSATLQQVLRVIINITFDEHCRYQLQKADAPGIINSSTSQSSDNSVFSLSNTAIKNLSVPVSGNVQVEVNNRLASGGVEVINAPKVHKGTDAYNFSDLDKALEGYGGSGSAATKKPSAPASKPHQNQIDDDLNSLLTYQPPKKPETKPSYTQNKPSQQQHNDLDLDDFLMDHQKPKAQTKQPTKNKSDLDEIDDLLAGIDTGSKKNNPPPSKPAPVLDDLDDILAGFDSKPAPKPAPQANKHKAPIQKDLDDIDDLLSNMNPRAPPARGGAQVRASMSGGDEIDDLLNGIGGGGSYGRGSSAYGGSYGDDIDDLLSDLSAPPRPSNRNQNRGTSSGLDEIDDLLADLTG